MSDSLDGYRGRTQEEIDAIIEVFDYLKDAELDTETMRLFDLGTEAKQRLETDPVDRHRFESLRERISRHFHEWLHTDPGDADAREALYFDARVAKCAIDELMTLPKLADEIARQKHLDGDDE